MGLIHKQAGLDLDSMINNWMSKSGLLEEVDRRLWSHFIRIQKSTHEILPGGSGAEDIILQFLSRYEGELPPYIGFRFNTTSHVRLTSVNCSPEVFMDRLNKHIDSLLGLHMIEILSIPQHSSVQYIKFNGKFVKKNQSWD